MEKRLFSVPLLASIVLIVLISSQLSIVASAPRTSGTSILIESTPNPSEPNQAITISGRLVSGRQGLSYGNVRIDSSLNGREWRVIAWTKTKNDGRFALSWTPPQSTSLYMRAYFPGDRRYSSSFSNTILQRVLFDFYIAISAKAVNLQAGSSVQVAVPVGLLGGPTELVRLSAQNLPVGLSATLQPQHGYPDFTASLRLAASQSGFTGNWVVTIKGESGRISRSAQLTVNIRPSILHMFVFRGVNRQGMEYPDWQNYNVNEEDFEYMTTVFPRMNFVHLPLRINLLMPNSLQGDYTIVNEEYVLALDNWVKWCSAKNITLSFGYHYWTEGYYEPHHPADLFTSPERLKGVEEFFRFLARRYINASNVIGFDIANEVVVLRPNITQWKTFVEAVIDTYREVNPALLAFVQSPFYEKDGFSWVRNMPIERPNVIYVPHLYSHDWQTGEWYPWLPWSEYYARGDYEKGFEILNRTLYERFGFLKELGYPVHVREFSAPYNSVHSVRYLEDVIRIFEGWGISWAYFSWGSKYPDVLGHLVKGGDYWKTLNPQADILTKYIG